MSSSSSASEDRGVIGVQYIEGNISPLSLAITNFPQRSLSVYTDRIGLSQRLQMQQNSRKALDVEVAELKKGKKEAETDKRMIANTANDLKLEVRSLREQLLRSQQDME